MAGESMQDLMNSSSFAKLCGVSTQTVLNWVNRGSLKPSAEVGGKYFFSKNDYIQMKINEVKSFTSKSFLGVIIEESDEEVLAKESSFVSAVKKHYPKASFVKSLSETLSTMLDSEPTVSDAFIKLFAQEVKVAFCDSVVQSINEYIMDIISLGCFDSFTVADIKSIIFGEADESLIARWDIVCKNEKYNSVSIKNMLNIKFGVIKSRFGLIDSLAKLGVSIKDSYLRNFDIESVADSVKYDKSCSGSRVIYEKFASKVSSTTARAGIESIGSNGYFTTISSVGSLSAEDEARLMSILSSNEYSVLYISNKALLSPTFNAFIEFVKQSTKLETLEV